MGKNFDSVHFQHFNLFLTHIHKQCESMEWRKRWASRPCTELLAPTIFHTLKHSYQYTYLGL